MSDKLLFLLQTHKNPDQIWRLTDLLRKRLPSCVVIISHDQDAAPLSRSFESTDGNVKIIKGKGGRGDFTILDGYLDALRWIESQRIEYDWLINISANDLPVRPLDELRHKLSGSTADAFLQHWNPLDPAVNHSAPQKWSATEGVDRYYFQYIKITDDNSRLNRGIAAPFRLLAEGLSLPVRVNTAYGIMIGHRSLRHPFSSTFRCYAGSYWHVIRRRCCQYVLSFCDEHKDFVQYYRRVLIPDESFFQTILVNAPEFSIVNDNLRYVSFSSARHGHPRVLTRADLEDVRRSGAFFARKFDLGSGEDLLNELVAGA